MPVDHPELTKQYFIGMQINYENCCLVYFQPIKADYSSMNKSIAAI